MELEILLRGQNHRIEGAQCGEQLVSIHHCDHPVGFGSVVLARDRVWNLRCMSTQMVLAILEVVRQ